MIHKTKLEDCNDGYIINIIDSTGNIYEYTKDPIKQEPCVGDNKIDMNLYSEKSKISNINSDILQVIKNNDIAFILPYLIKSDIIFNYNSDISPHKFLIDQLMKLNIYDKSIDKYDDYHGDYLFYYSDNNYEFHGWHKNNKKRFPIFLVQ